MSDEDYNYIYEERLALLGVGPGEKPTVAQHQMADTDAREYCRRMVETAEMGGFERLIPA